MKNFLAIIFLLFFVFSCKAQLNNLNDSELFYGVKFNGISLDQIWGARGNLNNMRALFGNNLIETQNNTGPFIGKELYNDNIVFSFEDETDSGNNFDLTSIDVLNPNITVNVKGLAIKIGDSRTKFSNFLFNTNSNSYVFTDADTGSVSLSFKIDNSSNTVSEISFIAF